jgi:hypothetical protein
MKVRGGTIKGSPTSLSRRQRIVGRLLCYSSIAGDGHGGTSGKFGIFKLADITTQFVERAFVRHHVDLAEAGRGNQAPGQLLEAE